MMLNEALEKKNVDVSQNLNLCSFMSTKVLKDPFSAREAAALRNVAAAVGCYR